MKNFDKRMIKMMTSIADYLGRPLVFCTVVLAVVVWFIIQPFLEYDVWFDIIDLTIFITTFFFLFVIQSSQNADTEAMQDKLDDIIRALPGTHTEKEGEEKDIKDGKKILANK